MRIIKCIYDDLITINTVDLSTDNKNFMYYVEQKSVLFH